MEQTNNKEVVLNKMEQEETLEELTYKNSFWSRNETIQVLWFFSIAFVMLLGFGFLINKFFL